MGTIFISYRRGDGGWAGRLHADLEGGFATFFDERLQPGEPWPEHIRQAAQECSVMMVAIGPHWVKRANVTRLQDPDDWVRQELEFAFGRGEGAVLVIPVLFDGAALPDAARLPPSVRRLVKLQNFPISRWDSDLGVLVESVRKWLSGRATAHAARASFPRILPYLCDRIEQREGLEDLVAASGGQGVFACVLHGEAVEGHDSFVDRLDHERLFDRVFDAKATGVAVHRLDWNRDDAKRGNYGFVLRRALQRVLGTASASDGDLVPLLLTPGRPGVMTLQIASLDYNACGAKVVTGLIDAWFGLFGNPRRQPSEPLILWINVVGPEPIDGLWPELETARALLPRLESLREGHILEWIAKADVKVHVAGREAKLLRICRDGRWRRDNDSVPMLHFAEAVEEILTR